MPAFFKLFRRVFGYSAVLLVSKGLTLATSYLVALRVDDTEFGYFTLAQALFLTAVVLFGFNTSAAFIRFFYSAGAVAIYNSLKRLNGLLLLLVFAVSLSLYLVFRDHRYFAWFALLPLSGFLTAQVANFNAVFRCSNDLLGYSAAELGRPLLVFAALLYLLYGGLSISVIPFYLLAMSLSLLFVVIYSGIRLRRSDRVVASSSDLSENIVISYLFPLFLVQVMALLNNVGDRYFLSAFVSVDEIGRYGKAYLIGSTVGMAIDSFSLLWAPYVVKKVDSYKDELFVKSVVVFGSAVGASFLLLFLASAIYIDKLDFYVFDYYFCAMSLIVLAAFIVRVGYQIFVPVLNALDLTGMVSKLSFVGAVFGVMANLALIPVIGAMGAAIATWVSFFTFSMLSFYYVQKRMSQI